jgi:hypothetical protein
MFLAPGCIFLFSLSQNPMIVSTPWCQSSTCVIAHWKDAPLNAAAGKLAAWVMSQCHGGRQQTNMRISLAKDGFSIRKMRWKNGGVHQQK